MHSVSVAQMVQIWNLLKLWVGMSPTSDHCAPVLQAFWLTANYPLWHVLPVLHLEGETAIWYNLVILYNNTRSNI